ARPRHDPRVGPQDQPRGGGRGGLAPRWGGREPGGADPGAGLRLPRRSGRQGYRRRRADALLEAARAGRVPASRARGAGRAAHHPRRLMATDVTMPRLSDSMEEGTILNWIVEEGAEVKRGEPLVEIETDKANMTYESDTDGTLIEIVAKEGDTLPIGEVIARIGEAGEKPSGDRDAPGKAAEAESKAEEAKTKAAEAERALGGDAAERDAAGGNGAGERVKASPVARRMARDMGVELAQLEGSGPGGRIVKADVEAAAKGDGGAPAETAAPKEERKTVEVGAKGEVETKELTRIQRTVSRRMAESKATAPDYALHMEVDITLCVELRRRLKEVEDPAPSFNDMIVKACANALREHPRVNGA